MAKTKTIRSKSTKSDAEGVGRDGHRSHPAPLLLAPGVIGGRTVSGPTVEQAIYGLLFVAALGTRFALLGSLAPLSPLEAAQVWPAWLDAVGRSPQVISLPHSPLLYTMQRFLFWLTGGGSDLWARAFPALVGSLLVLVPWGLRRWIGRCAALLLAFLFVIDPWLLTFSRLGDGAILSVMGALLLVVGWLNWDAFSVGQRRWLAVAAGLTLVSGPLIWLLLPVLIATMLLFPTAQPVDRREGARLAGLVALGVVAGATGWLAYWKGLGAISTSVGVVLAYLTGTEVEYPLAWPFLRLFVDQPLLWGVGLIGLIALWLRPMDSKEQRRWRWLLTGWTLYGVALLLLPGRNPATLLVLALPLLIATAQFAAELLRFCLHEVDWQEGLLIAVAVAILLVTTFFWTAYASRTSDPGGQLLLFYLLLPLLVTFFVWWSGWRTTGRVTLLITLAVFALVTVSSSWMMNLRPQVWRAGALHAEIGEEGVRLLAEDVARLSAIRAGAPGVATVWVQVSDETLRPLLGWYLRGVEDLRFAAADPAAMTESAFVVTDAQTPPTLPADAVGSDYAVASTWQPTQIEGLPARLRWLLFRELKAPPATRSVILWVRRG